MTSRAIAGPPQGRDGVREAAIKQLLRTKYRLQLLISGWIYEVTSPRHALRCFATPVETRSPPSSKPILADQVGQIQKNSSTRK
jgi:hypothetical protein